MPSGGLDRNPVSQDDVHVFNVRSQVSTSDDELEDEDDQGDSNLILLTRQPVIVTTRNKIVCVTAYVILILSMIGYLSYLSYFHIGYNDVASYPQFIWPISAIYAILGCDLIASAVGIWTCVTKTGPQPMIYACIWLLLSSLFNACIAALLLHKSKPFEKMEAHHCKNQDEICKAYSTITTFLWCSMSFIVLKVTVIILCRLNYPQVFNWLLGKQVLVDEEIVNNMKSLTQIGTLGAGYFDPCDVERLAARGSCGGTVLGGAAQNTIIVTKRGSAGSDEILHEGHVKNKRPTLISISAN